MEKGTIKVMAGKLNGASFVNYWNACEYWYVDIGDYVIAENKDGYDLVEVIGIMKTTEELAKKFFTGGKELKNVVSRVTVEEKE